MGRRMQGSSENAVTTVHLYFIILRLELIENIQSDRSSSKLEQSSYLQTCALRLRATLYGLAFVFSEVADYPSFPTFVLRMQSPRSARVGPPFTIKNFTQLFPLCNDTHLMVELI